MGAAVDFSFSFFFETGSLTGVVVPLSPLVIAAVFCFFLGGSAVAWAVALGASAYSGVPFLGLGSDCAA